MKKKLTFGLIADVRLLNAEFIWLNKLKISFD